MRTKHSNRHSKNHFRSNYREWEFKLLKCDVLSGPLRPCVSFQTEIESVLILTISMFPIFIMRVNASRVVQKWFNIHVFIIFGSQKLLRGWKKFAQMCKKLNSWREKFVGRVALIQVSDMKLKLRHMRTPTKVWKIFSVFNKKWNQWDFNGNFHQKSSAKCVRSTFDGVTMAK